MSLKRGPIADMDNCVELAKLMDNEECKKCKFYHINQGEVNPELKHYCFFAGTCLSNMKGDVK
jgi:hypothetical protein